MKTLPQRKQRKQRPAPAVRVPTIPMFKSEIETTRKIRFKATSSLSAISLAPRELSSAVFGVVATASTTSAILVSGFKLLKVEVYFLANNAGNPQEAVIDWFCPLTSAGSQYAPTNSVSAVSTSIAEYTRLSSRPDPNSWSGTWKLPTDTTGIIRLSAPSGSIIDITCVGVYNDSDAVIAGAAVSGATVGLWYHKQPDVNMQVMGDLNTIA